jgi:hypothetical protein
LKVRLSRQLQRFKTDDAIRDFLGRFEGADIRPPRRFAPDPEFLRFHNREKFLDR